MTISFLPDADALPTLAAARIRLRWITSDDVPALFAVFGDADVARYWSSPRMTDAAEAVRLVDDIHAKFAERSLFQWGIERLETPGLIGTCTLARLDGGNRRAELGYALGRAAWGSGYATEAVGRVLRWAFTDGGLHRVEADVDPRNAASLRLLERHAFRLEGRLPERWFVDGAWQDSVLYGVLGRDWLAAEAGRAGSGARSGAGAGVDAAEAGGDDTRRSG